MSRNGSGVYTLPPGINPVVQDTTITSNWANTTLADIAAALTQSLARDGQTTPIANLPMGGFRHTGVGNPDARNQYASLGWVQDGRHIQLTSVGGSNAITGQLVGNPTALRVGQLVQFTPVANNTGPVTLNVNSIGPKPLVNATGGQFTAGGITAGHPYLAVYDGTSFIVVNANDSTLTQPLIIDNPGNSSLILRSSPDSIDDIRWMDSDGSNRWAIRSLTNTSDLSLRWWPTSGSPDNVFVVSRTTGILDFTGGGRRPTISGEQIWTASIAPAPALRWPAWNEVTSKPTTFPSTWSDVSGKPSTFPSTWATVSGKPDTALRWPAWGEVTGKPSTFSPSSHQHSAADITSGTLPIARGGTGGTSAAAARTALGAVGNSGGVAAVFRRTQAQYNAITNKDPNTLYVIVG